MRAFAIADASRRKAKPVGALLWEPDPSDERGRFSLEIASRCTERDLPLSLSFCLDRKHRCASPRESAAWVESRIVPQERQNIAEVLLANGLTGYDEVNLLALCEARSSDDDFFAYEVALTEELAHKLAATTPGAKRADLLLSEIGRKRSGGKVYYAVVELPADDPAQRIGRQIRLRRQEAGLTQAQLATRVGITQTVVSRVESGTGNPTLNLLNEIASALDTELDVSLT